MRAVGGAVAVLASVSLCAPAAGEPRQPTGSWHVQFDGVQCVGLRDYGTESDPLTLALKPSPSGRVMRLYVIRKGLAELSDFGETVRFENDKLDTNSLYFEDDTNTRRMVAIDIPMAKFKAHLNAGWIGIEGAPYTGTFGVTDLPSVVGGLDRCLLQLRDRWNIGPEHASRIATEASGSLKGIIQSSDYPRTAISRDQEGTVSLIMLVDVDGKIPDCGVDQTSGAAFLDAASCYFITHRARIRPALGPDGHPVRSSVTSRITWQISR